MIHGFQEVDVRRATLIILIHLVPFHIAFTPVTDLDIWWHLAAGQWIWANNAFPQTDPFSWGGSKPWQAYSWGFEVLVYGLYRLGGLQGLTILKAGLLTAIVWRLFSLLRFTAPDFSRASILILPAIFVFLGYLHIRPWLFTILCMILLFEILFRARAAKDSRYLLWLPPIFLFWANVHIQFIYGIGVLGIFLVAAYHEQKFADRNSPPAIPYWHYGIALFAAMLATLLNPYHYRIYETIWLYAQQSDIYPLISELSPLSLTNWWSFTVFALAFMGVWRLGKARFTTLLPYVLIAVAAFMSLRMLRDSWFLMLVVLLLFTDCFTAKNPCKNREMAYRLPSRFRWISVSVIALGAIIIATVKQIDTPAHREEFSERYPVEAVKFLDEQKPPGPLFNHFNWGGYLIWHLPGYQVSFDGRTNVYGSESVLNHVKTWRAVPAWQENPLLTDARLIVAPRDKPLVSVLRLHPDYEVIHEDKTAVVFAAR